MDGVFGPRTRAAIRAWQASRGDEESGYLDEKSSNRLGAADGGCPAERQARNAARIEPEPAPAPVPARSKGDVFRDCDACPEMVVMPAGEFLMGSPDSERGRFSGEGPVHRVTLDEPFAVGLHEVTFEEWDACVLDGGCGGYRPHDEGWGRGRRPVINVSWDDARSYVEWLSQRTGEEYRLPSESEWEYVARAGTRTPFHFGETVSTDQANYDGNHTYGRGRKGPFRRKTMPVDSFSPNRFGLHEVHGNVWEWVQDCRSASYERPPADGSARETEGCSDRMARGGSWNDLPAYLRSAFRNAYQAGVRRSTVGFRVARALHSTGLVQEPKSAQRGASSTPLGQDAASANVELTEETSTPTRTLPSGAVADQAAADSREATEASSPAGELTEETSTPTRDRAPDAGRTPPPTIRKGEVFQDCAHCPEMVVVAEGEFLMGSPSAEGGRWEDENPSHWVTIPGPFAVGRHEVTFAEFDACHRDGGCSQAPGDEGWGRGSRPVIHVSWKDAKEYVGWLSEKTGREYRLLSESEWEYAARAGTDSSYYWGEEPGKGHANCSRCGSDWESKKTSQAGSFDPNGFGLFDMLGNVWEWVEDCGHRNYEGAPTDGSAWVRRGDCRFRMLRGGSWEDPPSRVRSAFRHWESAGTRNDVIGFRVAAPLR